MILTLKTRHPGTLGAGESSWGVGNSRVPLRGRGPRRRAVVCHQEQQVAL